MARAYYSAPISDFLRSSPDEIIGNLAAESEFPVERPQTDAWAEEIRVLKQVLQHHTGGLHLEYSIPRMGRRIDAVVVTGAVVFVLEFKVGETHFQASAIDQVWDYALDLKNFHRASHDVPIAPILIATDARIIDIRVGSPAADKVFPPIESSSATLDQAIKKVLTVAAGAEIEPAAWAQAGYHPTPTIIEAATALYTGHSVAEISRNDASAINLAATSEAIDDIVARSKGRGQKAICFVTGVPGAGKTLVGLNIATKHMDTKNELYSVFLSGNGPLVAVLREALARDKVRHELDLGRKRKIGEARRAVKAFVQNIYTFRDEALRDPDKPPVEHVSLFDEAQRAWDLAATARFMKQKRNRQHFSQSEPQFLLSYMNRHPDWGVVVCLVGGGQEINKGEVGIAEWIRAIKRHFPDWYAYVSPRLVDSEYAAGRALDELADYPHVAQIPELHLAVSMRSFRAENVSLLVKQLLDLDADAARKTLAQVGANYPIVLTHDLDAAKEWLRSRARGSERYGMVVSSQAKRLKPYAIDVRPKIDPVHWFLHSRDDIRSSFYLEDVATEFDIQGLELDWACVTWDADFRYADDGWNHWAFKGSKWQHINASAFRAFQKNAYRVLLTRARQGMIIVVPKGSSTDPTRKEEFYDPTFAYLRDVGLPVV